MIGPSEPVVRWPPRTARSQSRPRGRNPLRAGSVGGLAEGSFYARSSGRVARCARLRRRRGGGRWRSHPALLALLVSVEQAGGGDLCVNLLALIAVQSRAAHPSVPKAALFDKIDDRMVPWEGNMDDTNESYQPIPRRALLEFERLQFEQSIETYRAHMKLLIQVITALVVANVAVVGYAIRERIASIVLISGLFPLTVWLLSYIVFRLSFPLFYTMISIEGKYDDDGPDWLMSTFLAFTRSPEYIMKLRSVSSITGLERRMEELRSMPLPWLGSGKGIGRILLLLVALIQVGVSVVLVLFFNWRFL